MSRLLAPDEAIKLVHFTDPGDGLNTGYQLDAVASQAQATRRAAHASRWRWRT